MDVVVPPKFLLDTGILSWTDRKGSAGGSCGQTLAGNQVCQFHLPVYREAESNILPPVDGIFGEEALDGILKRAPSPPCATFNRNCKTVRGRWRGRRWQVTKIPSPLSMGSCKLKWTKDIQSRGARME